MNGQVPSAVILAKQRLFAKAKRYVKNYLALPKLRCVIAEIQIRNFIIPKINQHVVSMAENFRTTQDDAPCA